MAKVTAGEFQEKWSRRMKAAIPDMQAGIAKVTESPTAKAASKQDKMLSRLQARVADGTWAARLRAVSLQDWQQAITEKGIPRVSSGVDGASDKVQAFASQLLTFQDKAVADLAKLPDVTLDDSINRMTSFIRAMSKFHPK